METKELEKEFLTMIEAQKRTIYKVCYIYANDQDDLNDLYQETVLNLWKSFPRYRGDSTLNTWVYRIVQNIPEICNNPLVSVILQRQT